MVSSPQWNKWLLVVPLLLLGLLWFRVGQRPRPERFLMGLGGYPTAIAFSPDGETLVCASSNHYLQKWMPEIKKWRSFPDVIPGRPRGYPRGFSPNQMPLFLRLRFSPDGQTLYTDGSHSSQYAPSVAYAWDVATRRRKFTFAGLNGPAFDVSPDGRW